ncbi:MAG: DUF6316 family protein [Pseudomonadales bacterium]
MPATLPDWFAADQVFNTEDGWFVGVTRGFRIGPFAQQTQAEQHSRDLSAHLLRCRSTTEQVRVVRQFVFDQIHEHGRQVRSGLPPREPAAADAPAPPVRAGEAPKIWFRTNRVYAVGDVWFFSTREGIDIGPYASRDQAERDLECLIDILRRSRNPDRNLAAIRRFKDGLDPGGGR